jgi:predicted PurR-regulated permease PerM
LKLRFQHLLSKFFTRFFKKSKKQKIIKKIFGFNFFIILEYLAFIIVIVLMLSSILPKLITELTEITTSLPFLTEQVNDFSKTLKELKQDYSEIG